MQSGTDRSAPGLDGLQAMTSLFFSSGHTVALFVLFDSFADVNQGPWSGPADWPGRLRGIVPLTAV